MKTAILSILVLVAFISMSSFALPSPNLACLDNCDADFDLCIYACDVTPFNCDNCDIQLNACRKTC